MAISAAVGLLMAGGIPAATASSGGSHEKVFVCKYVGKPNVDERLQTGGNPIDVSTSSIKPFEGLGSYFADAQGQSYVLAWAPKGTPEPPVTDCPAPRGPGPVVTTGAVSDTTCTAFTTTTTTTTTPYVLVDGRWVLGVPVVTTGAPVITTPTAGQITAAGLDCTTPVPPVVDQPVVDQPVVDQPVVDQPVVDQPVVDQPVVGQPLVDQPVEVLGVTATAGALPAGTANPLPAGASAGEADTSGQAVAGALTGLAALLVLGAGFMLRRRRGEV